MRLSIAEGTLLTSTTDAAARRLVRRLRRFRFRRRAAANLLQLVALQVSL
jgi:hypothetical protein